MISYKLFSHSKPLGPMIREILALYIEDMTSWPFCFQHKAKITLRQAFLPIYIMYKFDEASCNTLSFRTCKWFSNNQFILNGHFGCLKWGQNFYRHVFTAINILCKYRYLHKWMRYKDLCKNVTNTHMHANAHLESISWSPKPRLRNFGLTVPPFL